MHMHIINSTLDSCGVVRQLQEMETAALQPETFTMLISRHSSIEIGYFKCFAQSQPTLQLLSLPAFAAVLLVRSTIWKDGNSEARTALLHVG